MTVFYRKYKSYKEYLEHQASKLDILLKKRKSKWNKCVRSECFDQRVRKFINIFEKYILYMKEGKVLCLGARNGAEVKALRKLGFKDAIGIDLNPGKSNRYVIKGDFHDMPFEDNSFDNVFTNSLDHIFDIDKLSKEIHRVLIPSGILILEIAHFLDFEEKNRLSELSDSKLYESFCCDNFKDIKNAFNDMSIVAKWNKNNERMIIILKNKK